MKIAVIDGLGGGLGSQIVDSLQDILNNLVEIIAFGTNSKATSNMINSGAQRGATGENAICYSAKNMDIVIGPIGIIIPNSMYGEITPAMAEAIVDSPAEKFLIGIRQSHVKVVGMKDVSINELIKELTQEIKEYIDDKYLI